MNKPPRILLPHMLFTKDASSGAAPDAAAAQPPQEDAQEARKRRRALSRRTRHRVVPAVLLGILATLAAMVLVFLVHANRFFERLDDSMFNALSALETRCSISQQVDDTIDGFNSTYCRFLARLTAATLDRCGFSADTLQTLPSAEGLEIYVCHGTKLLFSLNTDAEQLPLDSSGRTALRKDGLLETEDALYTCADCAQNNATVILCWSVFRETETTDSSALSGTSAANTLVIRTDSGRITAAPEDALLDTVCEITPLPSTGNWGSLLDNSALAEAELGYAFIGDCGLCLVGSRPITSTLTGVYYYPVKDVLYAVFDDAFVQLALLAVIMAGLLLHAAALCRSRLMSENVADVKPLHGRWCLDRTALSHIAAMTVFCLLLYLAPSLYTHVLTGYSTQNITASAALESMTDSLQEDAQNEQILESYYYSACRTASAYLSWLLGADPTLLDNDGMALLCSIADGLDLTAYDENAVSVASTTGFTGYQLAEDESDPTYVFRELLLGSSNSMTAEDTDDGRILFGYRRMDAPGLLILEVDASPLQSLELSFSPQTAILGTDFGSSSRGYIDTAAPTVLHWAPSGSAGLQDIPVSFDEEVLTDGYSGVQKIAGVSYYLNVTLYNGTAFLSAYPLSFLYSGAHQGMLIGAGYCAVMFLLLSLCTVFFRRAVPLNAPAPDPEEDEPGSIPQRSYAALRMDKSFRRITQHMFAAAGLLLAASLLLDLRFSDTPLLTFLFSTSWQKGLNIFSLTTILLVMVAIQILSFVLQRLILLFSDNLGPQGITVGHMLSGLTRVAGILGGFLYAVIQLGFNPTALLTSLGVTGVVFGLGAQNTVNDLLSGLFIIFEGNFHVGNWVEIDGWRGQVMDIGVRTTKINRGGNIKIFNNSEIQGVITYNRTESGALVSLSIDYAEDVDRVIALIHAHAADYRKENPHIIEGPNVHGVTDLADSGVILRLWALVDDANYSAAVERDIRRITKRIFDAEGITIPFPQVVLHDGADRLPGRSGLDG